MELKVTKKKARLIAYYLPQYHPIPENDEWWGRGFTEWVTVAQARPLFKGHEQPKIPGELGFYDLRLEETRMQQAELARAHGIEGFCYWHYWLGGGKMLLERPFQEVLSSKKPDFPFCLGWANHSWKGVFFGSKNRTLIEQTYPGMDDFEKHFYYLLKAFSDDRYIKVEGYPLFQIHSPKDIPECKRIMDKWRDLAHKEGLKGLHIVGYGIIPEEKDKYGLDAVTYSMHREIENNNIENRYIRYIYRKLRGMSPKLKAYQYKDAMKYFLKQENCPIDEYPSIVTNWDTTPRLGDNAVILYGCTPELFRQHVSEAIEKVIYKDFQHRILFVKSWNEWAEGNYLEPDRKYGRQFLEALRAE